MHLRNKFTALIFVLMCLVTLSEMSFAEVAMEKGDTNIVLVGASIGNGWHFGELPERMKVEGFKLEFIPVFDSFDKSPAIEEILHRDTPPDMVIIKECSVYFPGDLDSYKNKVKAWVAQLQAKNIDVTLATSVPITELSGFKNTVKEFVKGLMGKPDKMEQLHAYNDWLREYAQESGFGVLDLEKALRISDDVRYMNPKYDRGDHVHINPEGYKALDQLAKEYLLTLRAEHSK